MLSLIQKIFGSSKARVVAPASTTQQHLESTCSIPVVEVAHLRLATILERLPEELKPLVLKMPEASVTVALPISTIVKQLPSGAVKVSLATLHRQAPVGVLGPLPPGDKRMVDVPLSEVFRHIKPTAFKRRQDQKTADALDSQFNLFGDAENPYQISPTAPEDEPAPDPVVPEPSRVVKFEGSPFAPRAAITPPAVLRMNHDLPTPLPPPVVPAPPELSAHRLVMPAMEAPAPAPAPAVVAPPVAAAPPVTPPAVPLALSGDAASIIMPVEPLSAGWPEPIRNELAVLNGSARVALPKTDVSAGLARGRVTFTWGQIRGWMDPSAGPATNADEATELTLPLKIVAPIFLTATKVPKLESKPSAFAPDIPELFNAAREATSPLEELTPAAPAAVETPVEEEPAAEIAELPTEDATTVGQLFGQPDKNEWTPAELVANLTRLGGVSGAVVALQEGLLVAHSLPGDVHSEAVAAFLPQLFARLNHYAGEMKLGEVDDLLFTTRGAHCQIYRLGFIYFAVLGKPGETLPWNDLRLVADELARQTQKS